MNLSMIHSYTQNMAYFEVFFTILFNKITFILLTTVEDYFISQYAPIQTQNIT